MESCIRDKKAPIQVLTCLHESQAGTGRHQCAICAYAKGFEDGKAGLGVLDTDREWCIYGQWAPIAVLSGLHENQGGDGRHKCTICSYQMGFTEGISEWKGNSSVETELITHGVNIEQFIPDEEGRMRIRLHVEYERSPKNRAKAIEIHGTTCKACGFDFDVAYGELYARSFIEIHHLASISKQGGKPVNPETDLVPLCSNCHSMAHRTTGTIISVQEIKELIEKAL